MSNIRPIRDYTTCTDQHTNADMIVYQIDCIIGWIDNNLYMTVNGKVDDSIERINFDQYVNKHMIIDSFRKVECVKFTCRFFSNPNVRHELNETIGGGIRM